VEIKKIVTLPGGSINNAVGIVTNGRDYFLKYNNATRFPGMFTSEAQGLKLLQSKKVIGIPDVIYTGDFENNSFLILERIPINPESLEYATTLGQQLAALHRYTSIHFGLDHDNYIGSLKQYNQLTVSGSEFMIRYRFQPLIKMACETKLITSQEVLYFEKLYSS